MLIAKEGWLETARERGKPIPEARYRRLRRQPSGLKPPRIKTSVKDYHINVFWSGEDDCYVADIPDLFACSAFGDTPEEAVREVQVANTTGWRRPGRRASPSPKPDTGRLRTYRSGRRQ